MAITAMNSIKKIIPEENAKKDYKELYKKEQNECRKIAKLNKRLNKIIDKKTKELIEANKKLKHVRSALDSELEIAKNIQIGFLPQKLPELMNMDVAAIYIPAGKIGGDMYDIIKTKDNKTAVFIFDVSGHGVPAALIAAMAKMLFINYIEKYESPSEIFSAVNRDIAKFIKTGHYLTAFLGIIDTSDNSMVYSQAGHVRPVLYRAKTGEVTFLSGNSVFIGHSALLDIAHYHDNFISLDWSDKLLLYTDGLTEASNNKNGIYGSQRLSEAITKFGKYNANSFVDKIRSDNEYFRQGNPLEDDLTLLCIQIGCPEKILNNSGFTKDDSPEMLLLNSHDEIENICSAVLKKLDKKGYSNKDIFQVHTSMHEILSNAILHGNKFNSDKKVYVFYKVALDSFSVSVIDEGNGFDYSNLPDPVSIENIDKNHGKGLYVVKAFMDEIAFNDKGNRVKINKYQKNID